jgi:hypothetical protein
VNEGDDADYVEIGGTLVLYDFSAEYGDKYLSGSTPRIALPAATVRYTFNSYGEWTGITQWARRAQWRFLADTKIVGVELALLLYSSIRFAGSISFDRLFISASFPALLPVSMHIGRLRYSAIGLVSRLLSNHSVSIDLLLVRLTDVISGAFLPSGGILVAGAGGRIGFRTLRAPTDAVIAEQLSERFATNATVTNLAWILPYEGTWHVRGNGALLLAVENDQTLDFGLDPSAASVNVYYWQYSTYRRAVTVPYIWPNCRVIEVNRDPLNGDFGVAPGEAAAAAGAAAAEEPSSTVRDLSITILVLMVVFTVVVVVFIVLCSKRGGGDAEA